MDWKLTHPTILPFYGLAGLYLSAVHTSGFWSTHPIIPVLLKILPIWYLLAYIKFFKSSSTTSKYTAVSGKSTYTNGKPASYHAKNNSSPSVESSYKKYVTLGLAVSSIGDVLMTSKSSIIPGGAVFSVAHVLYVVAFRTRGRRAKYTYVISPLALVSLYTIASQVLDSYVMVIFVFVYNIMISATVISAICCHECNGKSATLFAAVGASLFGISDYVIAYDLFVSSIPHAQLAIMVTYYSAQLFIALSVNR